MSWTHRYEEFLLLLFLLLGLFPHGLVFLLHLLQRSDLCLPKAKRLLLIVCSESAELLLITLVLLTQRLRRRKEAGFTWFMTCAPSKTGLGLETG